MLRSTFLQFAELTLTVVLLSQVRHSSNVLLNRELDSCALNPTELLSSSTIFANSLIFQTFVLYCDSIEKPLGYRFLNALTTSGSKSLTPSNWFPNVTLEITKDRSMGPVLT